MQEAPTAMAEGPIEFRTPSILAVVTVMALTLAGCWYFEWDEGDPPPPPDVRGEWLAAHTEGDTEVELTVDIDEPRSPRSHWRRAASGDRA